MIDQQQYVILSLELHLYFGRIMKEHALFLEAGFTPRNAAFARLADQYKRQFETVLQSAFYLGNGIISPQVATSGELVTDFTLGSEQQTQNFTGISIDTSFTRLESRLYGTEQPAVPSQLFMQVQQLNENVKPLLDGFIDYKSQILNEVLSCRMFTGNYPLLIEHIIREAKLYQSNITALENNQMIDDNIKESELFWNQIMMEHALFIRGLLDPSENTLIITANNYANDYAELLDQIDTANDRTLQSITEATIQETVKYRDFKSAGTEGIAACKIRSIILPLLADHVLREANHYLRLLQMYI